MGEGLANPSSVHGSGRRLRCALDDAREQVARFLGATAKEIIFTSSGTEANHLAWNEYSTFGIRIVTSRVEHPSILAAAEAATEAGAKVAWIDVERSGHLRSEQMSHELEHPPSFISLQHANNETGHIYPVTEVTRQVRTAGTIVHTDAVQTAGKLPLQVNDLGVDLLSLSGHKLGALPGVGALYVRSGSPFTPLWLGGPQERGRRSGTENVLGIVALGAACDHLTREGKREQARLGSLRDAFERELLHRVPEIEITARAHPRLPNTSHVIFHGTDGESLMIAADLEGIDCATGAACSSGSLGPSHVLLAMGISKTQARGALRFSLGWNTTEDDLARVLDRLPRLVAKVRAEGKKSVKRMVT